jgi:hypothetical protein
MSKREKITLGSVNNGNYTVIPPEKIAESRKRISEHMKKVVREYKKKEWLSIQDAKKLRVNGGE